MLEKVIGITLIFHIVLCAVVRRVFLDNISKLKYDMQVLENKISKLEK